MKKLKDISKAPDAPATSTDPVKYHSTFAGFFRPGQEDPTAPPPADEQGKPEDEYKPFFVGFDRKKDDK